MQKSHDDDCRESFAQLGRAGGPESGITEALWGTRVSSSTVSDLNKKIYGTIKALRNRPIEGDHPYVLLDGIVLKRSWAGEVRNVSLLVAIGVNERGYREILGICGIRPIAAALRIT